MAAGRTHDLLTMLFAGALTPLFFIVPDHAIFIISGFVFSGLMFNGDLDTWSTPTKRWGPLRFYWWPYRKAFEHRSILTHGPIVGTVLRILYIIPLVIWWWPLSPESTMWLIIGLELGSMSHSLADLW